MFSLSQFTRSMMEKLGPTLEEFKKLSDQIYEQYKGRHYLFEHLAEFTCNVGHIISEQECNLLKIACYAICAELGARKIN